MKKSNKTTERVQFEISPILAKEIEQFRHESGMKTTREFFSNAIALWRWAAQKSHEGKMIAALKQNPSGDYYAITELSLPALEKLRRNTEGRTAEGP